MEGGGVDVVEPVGRADRFEPPPVRLLVSGVLRGLVCGGGAGVLVGAGLSTWPLVAGAGGPPAAGPPAEVVGLVVVVSLVLGGLSGAVAGVALGGLLVATRRWSRRPLLRVCLAAVPAAVLAGALVHGTGLVGSAGVALLVAALAGALAAWQARVLLGRPHLLGR